MSSNFTVKGQDWFKSTISIDDAIDKVCDAKRQRNDIMVPLKSASIGLDASQENITVTIDGMDYVPTFHALKQMATIMDVSHSVLRQYSEPKLKANKTVRYERDATDRQLLVALFKNGIRDGRVDPEKNFRFRTYTDGTLRAMLTEKYAIVDNVWYLEQIKDIFKNIGGDEPRFCHWRGNADTLYGNMLLPDTVYQGDDSDYGGMLSISNCEIGKRRLSILPSVFRSICTNGMIFGQEAGEKFSQVHLGNIDLSLLYTRIVKNINDTLPILKDGMASFMEMRNRTLKTSPSKMLAQIAQDYKLSIGNSGQAAAAVSEYATHETGYNNLFGIVNAITRAAQTFDPDQHVRMEEVAGNLMSFGETEWDAYNVRANSMSDKVYNKTYGIVVAT